LWPPRIAAVWRACSKDAKWTSDRLVEKVAIDVSTVPVETKSWLGPPHGPYGLPGDSQMIRDEIAVFFHGNGPTGADALVLVGHEPALGWLLDGWTSSPVPPPLASAEVACLVRQSHTDDAWRLWWVLTPSAESAIPELREKISSKMTAVALLGGFALTVAVETVLRVDDVGRHDASAGALTAVAAGLFGIAAILLIGALLAYDRLMMPPRFWSSRPPGTAFRFRWPRQDATDPLGAVTAWRPPSSAAWVLYQESIRIWRWFVHSALVVLALGVGCVTIAVALPWGWLDISTVVALVAVGALALGVAFHRPVIGVSD
jgi:hypothetical protein